MTIPAKTIPIDSKYKIAMKLSSGEWIYRLDPWVHRATYSEETTQYEGRFWEDNYKFKILVLKMLLVMKLKFMKLILVFLLLIQKLVPIKISLKIFYLLLKILAIILSN